jgi:hypothetical protein
VFLALGDPSAETVIKEPTLAARTSWRVLSTADARGWRLPVMKPLNAGVELHMGARGIVKRIFVAGIGVEAHVEIVRGMMDASCTGTEDMMTSVAEGVAVYKGLLRRS